MLQGKKVEHGIYPTATGWYRLKVDPYDNASCGADAKYGFEVTINSDDYGDAMDEANPVAIDGDSRDGVVDQTGDEDWFYFYAPSSGTLTYHVCSTDSMTPRLSLYNSAGTYLDGSLFDNQACRASSTTHSLTTAGLYFVRIRRISGDTTGTYSFKLSMSSSDLDSDTKVTAFEVEELDDAPYLAVATDFDSGTDVDWYSFQASEREHWQIATFALEDDVDTYIELYAADDIGMTYGDSTDLLFDDNGGYGPQESSRISFVAPRSGEYFIKVTEIGSDDAGRYGILFIDGYIQATTPPYYP